MNGTDLLAEFRRTQAEAPFGELVRRYANLVYSVAKRRLGNGSLAEEVTQSVFIRLAKAAPNLRGDAELVAWLHRTTVHASIDLWRSEARRRAREEHAAAMQPDHAEPAVWHEIAPVLDEALNELNDAERQVILLRFFEQKSMRELGLVIGISEDAAKMRVSRAMERLRTLFSEKGVTCGAGALGVLLAERSVEAAPIALVLSLATLELPLAAGVGGAWLSGLFFQLAKSKPVVGTAAALLAGVAAILWLRPQGSGGRSPATERRLAPELSSGDDVRRAALAASDRNAVAEERAPDPLKLLQGVARARNRVASGEMEFTVASYEFSNPSDGTNVVRVQARFDGTRRRFESFAREYAYASMAPDAAEVTAARRRAEGLDHEAAVQAGLLKPFESHHVTAYDGAVLLDYWENDGRPVQAGIQDPEKGSGGIVFEPRCLGIDIAVNATDTIETCLQYENTSPAQLIGEESVEGIPAWHVRVRRWSMDADFWFEAANPVRVLKHTFNGSTVTSTYDQANQRDPIPTEVVEMFLHGTVGTQTAFSRRQIIRRNAQFNIAVDPASWTLAGLGMQRGTDVVDYRISRGIGYWNGAGLSEDLPSKTSQPGTAPDRTELLALLDVEPSSAAALAAAQWILLNTPDGPEVSKAAEVILEDHIQDTNLVQLSQELERLRHRCSPKLLAAMVEQNPSAQVRGNACLTLATLRKDDSKFGEDRPATAEAVKLFERVITEFGQVERNRTLLGELAKPELSELQRLTIGKPAPEIEGQDLEGDPLRLSDYRGKVVLLVFWGACGGCRPDVPRLLELQDRLAGKPFAILGVYGDADVAKAREIVESTGMTWPTFRDGRTGPIARAWNNQAWPVFQVLDAQGIIRHRNVWQLKLAEVVEGLMAE